MSFVPKPQEIYKHFKGNLYQIITIARHSETGEELVVYQAMYGDFRIYARELSMFLSPVDRVKYPEATQVYRFERQGCEGDPRRQEEIKTQGSGESNWEEPSVKEQPVEEQPVEEQPVEEQPVEEQPVKEQPVKEQPAKEQPTVTQKSTETPAEEKKQQSSIACSASPAQEDEFQLDPMLVQFLDADTYEEKLNILAGLHHRITQEMITTMAIASDVEIGDGEIEDRYSQLKTCLLTLEKYECNRMRG